MRDPVLVTSKLRSHRNRGAALCLVVGVATSLAACANVWGFADLTEGDASAGATTTDASLDVSAEVSASADVAADDGAIPDDSESPADSASGDAAATDAADASEAILLCPTHCPSGCCDVNGTCQNPSSTACGTGGQQCVDCKETVTSCITGPACCGTKSGQCGCSAISLVCNKN